MAFRHQLFLSYRFFVKEPLDSASLEVGYGSSTLLPNTEAELVQMSVFEDAFAAAWIKCNCIMYTRNMIVRLDVDDNEALLLGNIVDILVIEGKAWLVLELWKTESFDDNF